MWDEGHLFLLGLELKDVNRGVVIKEIRVEAFMCFAEVLFAIETTECCILDRLGSFARVTRVDLLFVRAVLFLEGRSHCLESVQLRVKKRVVLHRLSSGWRSELLPTHWALAGTFG